MPAYHDVLLTESIGNRRSASISAFTGTNYEVLSAPGRPPNDLGLRGRRIHQYVIVGFIICDGRTLRASRSGSILMLASWC